MHGARRIFEKDSSMWHPKIRDLGALWLTESIHNNMSYGHIECYFIQGGDSYGWSPCSGFWLACHCLQVTQANSTTKIIVPLTLSSCQKPPPRLHPVWNAAQQDWYMLETDVLLVYLCISVVCTCKCSGSFTHAFSRTQWSSLGVSSLKLIWLAVKTNSLGKRNPSWLALKFTFW